VERTIRVSNDLKTEPYFDSKSYPKATAKILEVKKIEGQDKKYVAKIELKIKKYKKVVDSEFELLNDTQPYQIKGEINVLKEDFQVGMGNNMGTIKSEVKILYETELKLSE
jgi:polyisoprenoid-binding protein YceI